MNDTVVVEPPAITLNTPPTSTTYTEISLSIKNNLVKLIDNVNITKEEKDFIFSLMDGYIKEYLLYKFAPTEEKKNKSKINLEHYDSALCSIKNTFQTDFMQKINECIASIGGDVCQTAILGIL